MSKRMTRVLSLILTLVMFVSVSTPAFAWGGGDLGSGWDRDIGEDEIRDFDEPVVEEEEPYDYFQTLEEDSGTQVTVEAPMGSLPTLAELRVETVEAEDIREAVESVVEGEANILVALDISFWLNGVEIEPDEAVRVKISAPELDGQSNLTLVHIPDADEPETLDLIDDEDLSFALGTNEIAFEANSFSVYAVIGKGEEGDNARLKVVFKNGDTEIETMLVKKADTTASDYDKIVYDPGVGELENGLLFRGWTLEENYTKDTEAKDIDDIRAEIAKYFNEHTVKEGDTLYVYALVYTAFTVTYMDGENVSLGSETILIPVTQKSVEYTINQAYTPGEGENFEGWLVSEGADKITPPAGVQAPYPNGTKVTLTGSVILSVNAPAGQWLVFHENNGTYVAPQFVKSGETPDEPTVEMKRLGYTFAGWFADEACTTPFDFNLKLTTRTHAYAKWTPRETANYTVIIWKQNVAGTGYDFADSQTLNGTVGDTISLTTSSTSVRVGSETYSWTGFKFKEYDTGKKIATEGNTIVNVYFDRITVTLHFYRFNATGYERTYDSSAQTGVEYYGRSNNTYFRIYYYEGSWIYEYNGRYYYYNDNRYIRSGSWQEITNYRDSGLYGSQLNKEWPTDYNWYDTQYAGGSAGGTRTTFLDAFLPSDGSETVNFYGQTVEGTVQIRFFKQNAAGTGYELANTVYGTAGSGFYISDKYNGFTAYQYSVDGGALTSVGQKDQATGYYNGGVKITYNTGMDIYFNRDKYNILYQDGVYVDGDGNPVEGFVSQGDFKTVKDIIYGGSLASYNKGGNDYYDPTEDSEYDNFVFAGWYTDDKCQNAYTFTTMPEGITVYAKWVRAQYRVFLHPQVDPSDTSLDWGSDDQQMNFRISAGDKVSAPTGLRDDFEMVGWYLDKDYTQLFNADAFVLNDTTVTTPYDKTKDFTDPMDEYGNGATWNSDVQDKYGNPRDRFWITKKLDLYANWRAKITGAQGIGIVYDAREGTNAPTSDNLKYLDKADAVAQAASTAPAGQRFLYWVVQKWNGSAWVDTDVTVYPGDTFKVYKADSREQDITDGSATADVYKTYTIQLRAEYGEAEAPDNTHITFYANGGEYSTKITGENIKNGDTTLTYTGLKINEAVAIPGAENFTRFGYKFLGWARTTEPTDAFNNETGTVNESKYVEDATVTLWLKYNEETGKYDEMNSENADITEVAADEVTPYQAVYAVWERVGIFYVFHSSDGKVDAIDMGTLIDGKYDLTGAKKDGYLYGGYFRGYFNVTDEQAIAAAADGSAATSETYDGSAIYKKVDGKVVRYWNKVGERAAYTEDGRVLAPVDNTVYYLREVPAAFLDLHVQVVYDWSNDYHIDNLYLITTVDNNFYSEAGFKIVSDNKAAFYASYSIQSRNSSEVTTIKAVAINEIGGYVGVWDGAKTLITSATLNTEFTVHPYWITLDGVRVEDTHAPRTFNVGNGNFKGDGCMFEVKDP